MKNRVCRPFSTHLCQDLGGNLRSMYISVKCLGQILPDLRREIKSKVELLKHVGSN